MLEYTPKNLKLVSRIILKNLTPDLLPKKWVERNTSNPMFGHCHNASGCLQKVFGTKVIKLYRALDDENIYHWWAVDINGEVIDLTVDQYYSTDRLPPIYESGKKSGLLGFDYRRRVQRLTDKVLDQISSNGTPPQ